MLETHTLEQVNSSVASLIFCTLSYVLVPGFIAKLSDLKDLKFIIAILEQDGKERKENNFPEWRDLVLIIAFWSEDCAVINNSACRIWMKLTLGEPHISLRLEVADYDGV